MTAEPDIVERLRDLNPWKEMDWPEVCREAADTIDSLRTALATEYARGVEDSAKVADRISRNPPDFWTNDGGNRQDLDFGWTKSATNVASAIRALVPKP